MAGRKWSWVPAMQADPTAGGNRPEGCCCAWTERDNGRWVKGDDHKQCPVHLPGVTIVDGEVVE